MVGLGMIFDETYRPFFEAVHRRRSTIRPSASSASNWPPWPAAPASGPKNIGAGRPAAWPISPALSSRSRSSNCWPPAGRPRARVDFVCIATPDNRHFAAARAALQAGKHVLIEKPSVLSLAELDELLRPGPAAKSAGQGRLSQAARSRPQKAAHAGRRRRPATRQQRLLLAAGAEQHRQRPVRRVDRRPQPGHLRGGPLHQADRFHLRRPAEERPLHGPARAGRTGRGPDLGLDAVAVDLRASPIGREAAFDIHTSWVTPDNFPGYVEQEVQFRFDNGVWNGHGRKRGVECTIAGRRRSERKITPNNHYNGTFLEPWNERSQRGYGIEVLERFAREVAMVEFGGPAGERERASGSGRGTAYNDLSADRQTVAAVQAMEAILAKHAAGTPNTFVEVNGADGGLVLRVARHRRGRSFVRTASLNRCREPSPTPLLDSAAAKAASWPKLGIDNPRRSNIRAKTLERSPPPRRGRRARRLRTYTPSLAVIARSRGQLSLDARRPPAGRLHLGRAGRQPGSQPGRVVAARARLHEPGPSVPQGDGFFRPRR